MDKWLFLETIFSCYENASFRASMNCYRTQTHVGTNGPAYEYHIDGYKMIIRHNKNGTFTWIS